MLKVRHFKKKFGYENTDKNQDIEIISISNPSANDFRGRQSVRATFRLSEACIHAISILSAQLASLYGIGSVSSWTFVMEFFGWRQFQNRREVGGLAGLTPTPYDSGNSVREQGISKAGNQRIRALAVEIAWAWLRFQPQSKLSQWYIKRYADGGKRMRSIGIVAMARRLLIDLWRYLEYDKIPEGARLKSLA